MKPATSPLPGVVIQPLKQIQDERGAVLHMLRRDSPLFLGFGEIYFSQVNPGMVKAWKRHRLMNQHFAVPVGQIRLVLCDDRASPGQFQIQELLLGRPDHYSLIRIPPGLWYGFQGWSATPALVANCTDLPYDPGEVESLPVTSSYFPYIWKLNSAAKK